MKVALIGNPNSGKTTLFNLITGIINLIPFELPQLPSKFQSVLDMLFDGIINSLGILNLCEKKENAKSTKSCVKKLITTSKPINEYEISYKVRNVIKSKGERLPTTDIVTLVA